MSEDRYEREYWNDMVTRFDSAVLNKQSGFIRPDANHVDNSTYYSLTRESDYKYKRDTYIKEKSEVEYKSNKDNLKELNSPLHGKTNSFAEVCLIAKYLQIAIHKKLNSHTLIIKAYEEHGEHIIRYNMSDNYIIIDKNNYNVTYEFSNISEKWFIDFVRDNLNKVGFKMISKLNPDITKITQYIESILEYITHEYNYIGLSTAYDFCNNNYNLIEANMKKEKNKINKIQTICDATCNMLNDIIRFMNCDEIRAREFLNDIIINYLSQE